MKNLRFWRILPLAVSLTATGGQVSAWSLYSETRDAQAQAARDAWTKVDLGSQISVPKSNLAALLNEQLAVNKAAGDMRRDSLIQQISFSNDHTVDSMLTTLLGTIDALSAFGCTDSNSCWVLDPIQRKKLNETTTQAKTKQDQMNSLIADYTAAGQKVTCAAIPDGDAIQAKACAELADSKAAVAKLMAKTPWAQADAVAKAAAADLDTKQKPASDTKTEIAEDLETLENTRTGDLAAAAIRLQTNLNKLVAWQNDINSLDAFKLDVINDTKKEAADAFLATLIAAKDGKAPAATSPRAAMVVVLFAELFDTATKTLKNLDDASVAPIIAAKGSVAQSERPSARRLTR